MLVHIYREAEKIITVEYVGHQISARSKRLILAAWITSVAMSTLFFMWIVDIPHARDESISVKKIEYLFLKNKEDTAKVILEIKEKAVQLKDGKLLLDQIRAIPELEKVLLKNNTILYVNRYEDGWTNGGHADVLVFVREERDFSLEVIPQFPGTTIKLSGNLMNEDIKNIEGSMERKAHLSRGSYYIHVETDTTFVPKERFENAQDQRELGVRIGVK